MALLRPPTQTPPYPNRNTLSAGPRPSLSARGRGPVNDVARKRKMRGNILGRY